MPVENVSIEVIVVYDDDAREAESRRKRVEALVDELLGAGVLSGELPRPRVVTAIFRAECFEAVTEARSAIVIADLVSEDDKSLKGARLLRAIALREGVRERTWTIALTRRVHPQMATSLEGRVHALVQYPDDNDTAALRDAVLHALERPAVRRGTVPVFPRTAVDQYDERRNSALRAALFLAADAHIDPDEARLAFEMVRPRMGPRVPRIPADSNGQVPGWKSPERGTRLIRTLRKRAGGRDVLSADAARDHLHRHLDRLDDGQLWEPIRPEAALLKSGAWQVSRVIASEDRTDAGLWLTSDELKLARVFFDAVEAARVAGQHDKGQRHDRLDTVFADDDYQLARDALGDFTDWDTVYAVMTVWDWWWEGVRSQYEQREG